MTVQCPACGSESFRLVRGGDGDPTGSDGFAVFCSECDNATGLMVARTLDSRLQRGEGQAGLSEFEEGDR
jgi:hypothetical protein